MGISPHISEALALCQRHGMLDHFTCNSPPLGVPGHRNPVNGGIRLVKCKRAVGDNIVISVSPVVIAVNAENIAVIRHIQSAVLYVREKIILGRIFSLPLRYSSICKIFSRFGDYLHYPCDVGTDSLSYLHFLPLLHYH